MAKPNNWDYILSQSKKDSFCSKSKHFLQKARRRKLSRFDNFRQRYVWYFLERKTVLVICISKVLSLVVTDAKLRLWAVFYFNLMVSRSINLKFHKVTWPHENLNCPVVTGSCIRSKLSRITPSKIETKFTSLKIYYLLLFRNNCTVY